MSDHTRRRAAMAFVGVAAVLVAALLVVQSSLVRRPLLNWVTTWLAREEGLRLGLDGFEYNVLSRRITIRGMTLATPGYERTPLFKAGEIRAQLPWAAFAGDLAVQSVVLTDAVVTIAYDTNGVSNLPPSWDDVVPTPAAPERIDLHALTVRNLDVVYLDAANDLDVRVTGLRADLGERDGRAGEGTTGTVSVDTGIAVRVGAQRTVSTPVAGRVAFDGSTVSLQAIALSFPEADATLDGRVVRVLDTTALDLRFTGIARLAAAARWMPVPTRVGGTASLAGTITGTLDATVVEGTYASDNLALGQARGLRVNGSTRITPDVLTLTPLTFTSGDGVVEARVVVPFDDDASVTVGAEWHRLPLATVLAIAQQDALPVAATLEGTLTLDLGTGPAAPMTIDLENRARAAASPGTVPTDGRITAHVAGGRWQAAIDHRVPGAAQIVAHVHGTVDAGDVTTSTLAGSVDLHLTSPELLARALGHAGLVVPASVAASTGHVSAALQIGGRFDAPTAVGAVASDGLVLTGVGPAQVNLSLSVTPALVEIHDLRLAASGATLNADAHLALPATTIDGRFRLETPALQRTLATLPEAWRPAGGATGRVTVTGTLGGTLQLPQATATIRTGPIAVGAQHVDAIHADLRVSHEAVTVHGFEIAQGTGRLDASGRYVWSNGAYVANVKARGLVIEGVLGAEVGTRARFDLTFNGAGAIDRPVGQGDIGFALEGGTAGAAVGKGSAGVTFEGDIARFTAIVPGLGTYISGTIDPRTPYHYRTVVATSRLDLEPFARVAGARAGAIHGTLSLNALLTGRLDETDSLVAAMNLEHLIVEANGVPVALAAPARLRWSSDGLRADDVRLRVGTGQLCAAGHVTGIDRGAWTSTLQAEAADLLTIAKAFAGVPAELDVSGSVRLSWNSRRGFTESDATLTVTDGAFSWTGVPPVTGLCVNAAFDGTTIDITRLTGLWQDGSVDVSARLPRSLMDDGAPGVARARGVVKARLTGLTQAALAPWVGRETLDRLSGRLSATIDAEIDAPTLTGVRGTLVVDEATMTVDKVPVQQQHPSRLTIADGHLRIEDVQWTAGGNPLVFDGSVDLVAADPILDLGLAGRADLRMVSAFAPTMTADGSADLDIRIAGTASAPQFAGRITFDGAELALSDPQVILSDVRGIVQLKDRRIEFQGLTGEANGGRMDVTGGLDVAGLALTGGAVNLKLEGVALDYPRGLQSESDAQLLFTPGVGASPPLLSGRVRILRSAYLAPISLAAMAAANRPQARPISSEPAYADTIRLDVSVETVTDIIVDNNYGRFEAGSEFRLVGTVGAPGLTGRTALREGGEMYLGGNIFRVDRGSITFVSPTRIEPDFDIMLRTLVSGQDVTLTLSGTLDRLETDVRSSDPTVPADEIVSLLLGDTGAGFRGADAVTLLSAELLGATGRAVGLDSLRVERGLGNQDLRDDPGLFATETDPSARLTLSKRLRQDVEVIFSQNLRQAGLSAILSYRPRKNIELRGISRDNLDRAYALRHEITFGGGSTADRVSATPPVRVSALTITGAGNDEAGLARRLRLGPGHRFNFHTWQRDIDTLRRDVQDRGYFEARVRATRETDEARGTTALTYRLEFGPATELVIAGLTVPNRFRAELDRVWTRTVLNQFLTQEFEARTRAFLVERGFFGSVVRVDIDQPSARRKIVRVTIESGATVARREIRFEGQSGLDEGLLRRAIASANLEIEAWVAPDRLRRPLEDLYAVHGYLDARVRPGQPARDSDRAVLVVRIEEGPRYSVGAVIFEGAAAPRLDRARQDAALEAGVPYTSDVIERARRRVEETYLRQGFNAVRVDVRPTIDKARAAADVVLIVEEGPQQVLIEVVESGATRTRAGIINSALRLRLGEPVDRDEWALARKRLYDTNVFRQVDLQTEPAGPAVDGVEPVRARVSVQEWPAWRLRYGLQWNDEQASDGEQSARLPGETAGRQQSLGVVAELQGQNLFGRAISAGLFGLVESNIRTARTYVAFPRFFRLPVRTNVFVFAEHEVVNVTTVSSFVTDRTGISAEQRWRRTRNTQVSWSYRFERNHTYDPAPSPNDDFALDATFDVARLGVTTLVDRRDDPFNTRRGWFSSVAFEYAAPGIGSDLKLAKLYAQQKYFRPVGPVVLAAMVQVGTAFADALIPSERFRAGGGYTVRGYGENSLGPVDFLGLPRGGDTLLVMNQEVRVPLYKWARAVAFVDAGNVFRTRDDVSFRGLKVGYGLGLRLDTPFAMLRVDYGLPAPRGRGTSGGRWYFGIGHVF